MAGVENDFWLIVGAGIAVAIVAPTIMGLYLLLMLNGFGKHWNEAYSSLRIADFKGFLRLKIAKNGDLTVYPVVIESVPRTDDGELKPRFAEAPINIPKAVGRSAP
jgi:hypothetical protein